MLENALPHTGHWDAISSEEYVKGRYFNVFNNRTYLIRFFFRMGPLMCDKMASFGESI